MAYTWPYTNGGGKAGETGFAAEDGVIETDLFIVGAGPAGASLACFLAHYGQSLEADLVKCTANFKQASKGS